MSNTSSYSSRKVSESSPHHHYNGRRRLLIALFSICFICFMAFSQASKTNTPKSLTIAELEQDEIYYFADHGNGMSVAKYDRTEGENIYTNGSIKPLQLSYQPPGLWGTIEEAGDIRLATLLERIQLLLSIVAGVFVPYP